MTDPHGDGNQQVNYMHVVPGSTRWFCRADGCFAYSDGNVPYGYCDRHLAQSIAGSPITDKFGYPPVGGLTTGADSADSNAPRTVNGEARDPQSSSLAAADPALRALSAKWRELAKQQDRKRKQWMDMGSGEVAATHQARADVYRICAADLDRVHPGVSEGPQDEKQ